MSKFVKNTKKFVIYDSARYIDTEEVIDFCECNEISVPVYNTIRYWDIVREIAEMERDDFWEDLKYSPLNNEKFMITGTLGLWNGSPTIVPILANGLEEAINKTCTGSINDIKAEYDSGVLYVFASHHDGINCLEIHKLSKLGLQEIERPKYYYEDYEPKSWWFKQIKEEELF